MNELIRKLKFNAENVGNTKFMRIRLVITNDQQDISLVEDFDGLVRQGPDVEPGMGQAVELVVNTFPSEFWNHHVVSELGFDGDVLEVEIEVPVRFADLEVVASSG